MKKLILFLSFCLIFPAIASAQTATDSSLTEKIKERLEKTAEEGVDKIKDELTAKTKEPRKKAYLGSLKQINDDSLVLEYKGQNYTAYTQKKELFNLDDYLLILGLTYPETNRFEAKKIQKIPVPTAINNRQLVTGKIEEIDGNKVTVDAKKLTISTKTEFKIKDIAEPSLDDLQLQDDLFAIVILDKSGAISEVKNVLVLPGKNNPAATAPTNATQSAIASPSATIE